MQNILTLYKSTSNSKNRLVIKYKYTREMHPVDLDKIQLIIEYPSGEYILKEISPGEISTRDLYIIRDGRMKRFSIYDLIYYYEGEMYFFISYRIISTTKYALLDNVSYNNSISYTNSMYLLDNSISFSLINKLTINNQFISSLNLNSLNLSYLNLRSNFLSSVSYDKPLVFCDLRNNKLRNLSIKAETLLVDQKGNISSHNISSHNISRHKKLTLGDINTDRCIFKKYKIYNISYRFYILFRDIEDIEFILSCILTNIQGNLIDKIDLIYSKMKKITLRGMFCLVCVTEENVIIRTSRMRVMYDYFMRREILYKEHLYIFDNIGQWYLLPLIDTTYLDKIDLNTKLDKIDLDNINTSNMINTEYNTSHISNIIDYDYSVIITNQSNKHKLNIDHFKKCSVLSPTKILKKYSTTKNITRDTKLRFFMCVKFPNINKKKQESLLKKFKSLNYCTIIEDNGIDGMIYMSQDIKKLLEYALYMKKVYSSYKIDLSIGISCGNYFFKMENRKPKFMGDVLIKASRMTNLGKGVFCCNCATILENIYYQYIGERKVRGFSKCMKIYLVYKNN
ncbi:uncharacterized protein VNE69_08049 [Vairimorpha necatrix]|uniref:Uncharacterized protein n=1 Tax=Vairimorpha necatrix TaxID=6039 RepID=A0AAX4JEM9_9MICR